MLDQLLPGEIWFVTTISCLFGLPLCHPYKLQICQCLSGRSPLSPFDFGVYDAGQKRELPCFAGSWSMGLLSFFRLGFDMVAIVRYSIVVEP